MNWLNTVLVLGTTFLAVFWEAAFGGVRQVLGAQIDLLPSLVVYASLCTGLTTVLLLSFLGGLWFDSLSANPLGVSVLPLLVIGITIYLKRELILRDQPFAQLVLGSCASAITPLLSLSVLLTMGHSPHLGWGTLWQLAVMTAGGGFVTPIIFLLFERLERALVHGRVAESSFRPDREIRRGR